MLLTEDGKVHCLEDVEVERDRENMNARDTYFLLVVVFFLFVVDIFFSISVCGLFFFCGSKET